MASENGSHRAAGNKQPLYLQYPANSLWEISLSTGETVTGTVYCTDEVSNTVFIQKNLTHTTLATELRVLHASQITRSKSLPSDQGGDDGSSSSAPLPKVQKKALEEREKRAIRMAEESFRHINEKVRLMKTPSFQNFGGSSRYGRWTRHSFLTIPHSAFLSPCYRPRRRVKLFLIDYSKPVTKSSGRVNPLLF